MRIFINIIITIILIGLHCGLISCSGSKNIIFSQETFSISKQSGNIINSDSTLQFSFGNNIQESNMTIIDCQDSLQAYHCADKYIYEILKTCGLENCKVYFFAPMEKTMWVELSNDFNDMQPRAIVNNLLDERPYTSWVWNDDNPKCNRTSEEIYSNSFVNKGLGALIVVDKLTYGNIPMACLSIYQSSTKQTSKLGFKPLYWVSQGNLLDYSYIDILANWIDSRRNNLITNYKLGQTVEYRRNINAIKAELKQIVQLDQEPRQRLMSAWKDFPNDTLLHQKIGREIWVNDSLNVIRVREILDSYDLDFGEENEVVWAVIQHSSLENQEQYLPKFINAFEKGKLRGEFVAFMQDRIACRSGKPQMYGSQGSYNDSGVFIPAEIEDPENVDARRAKMGMCTLQEYIKMMSRN